MKRTAIETIFQGQRLGGQSAVLDVNNVNEFHNEQVANIVRRIDTFTSAEGTGAAVDHCIKLYLDVAKYEPLKGLLIYLSSTVDVQNTITTADTIVKTVETSFMELLDAATAQTQTESLTLR